MTKSVSVSVSVSHFWKILVYECFHGGGAGGGGAVDADVAIVVATVVATVVGSSPLQ